MAERTPPQPHVFLPRKLLGAGKPSGALLGYNYPMIFVCRIHYRPLAGVAAGAAG